jgi:hypothetical protein
VTDRPRPTDIELVDRLTRLRGILPLIATELAGARRRAHALEIENRRLAARIVELESALAGPRGAGRAAALDSEPPRRKERRCRRAD